MELFMRKWKTTGDPSELAGWFMPRYCKKIILDKKQNNNKLKKKKKKKFSRTKKPKNLRKHYLSLFDIMSWPNTQ